ncbi:MAG: discoidin domain-containing protein [Planctomycetota bacterium]
MSRLATAVLLALTVSAALAADAPAKVPIYTEPRKIASDYRNVALNPTAANTTEPTSYPHATSNSEYNKKEFAARCAIDGSRKNNDVHGCGSWGPQKEPDIWWRLDFGRPVEIDKLIIFLRAAWPHDSFWKEGTIEFSDGSTEKLALKKTADGQEFPIKKRTVTWLKLKDLVAEEPKWCALCEFEAWGKDAPAEQK